MAAAPEAFDWALVGSDLPIANVARLMKGALPENAKVAKEAKECVQECVSEFISFVTSEASDKCQSEKRKTINGEDILFAMRTLGFDDYERVLKIYLARYRASQPSHSKHASPPTAHTGTPASAGSDDGDAQAASRMTTDAIAQQAKTFEGSIGLPDDLVQTQELRRDGDVLSQQSTTMENLAGSPAPEGSTQTGLGEDVMRDFEEYTGELSADAFSLPGQNRGGVVHGEGTTYEQVF